MVTVRVRVSMYIRKQRKNIGAYYIERVRVRVRVMVRVRVYVDGVRVTVSVSVRVRRTRMQAGTTRRRS